MFQGSNTSLVCLGAGPEDSLSWEKVGSSLGANTTTVLGDRIIITTSSVSDRGLYVCNVETSCGAQARASALLEVSLHNMYSVHYCTLCNVHYCTILYIALNADRAERAPDSGAVPRHSPDGDQGGESPLPVPVHVRWVQYSKVQYEYSRAFCTQEYPHRRYPGPETEDRCRAMPRYSAEASSSEYQVLRASRQYFTGKT